MHTQDVFQRTDPMRLICEADVYLRIWSALVAQFSATEAENLGKIKEQIIPPCRYKNSEAWC